MKNKNLLIQLGVSALITAGCLVYQTKTALFIAGMGTAGIIFSTVGWWVVRQQQRRFNKWLSDAVSTEVMEPEADAPVEESVK